MTRFSRNHSGSARPRGRAGNHAVAAFTVLAEGMPDVNAITDVMARLSGTHPVFTPRLTALPGHLMLMYGSTMFFVHVLRDLVSHPELDNCWRRPWDVHARSRDVHLAAASLHGYEISPAASPCPGGCGGPSGLRRPAPAAVLRRRTHSDLRSARARSDCWPTLPHHPNPGARTPTRPSTAATATCTPQRNLGHQLAHVQEEQAVAR
jgi:hypothetical protein